MNENIRQAAIQAIKEGDMRKLRALKTMIGATGVIETYFQVLGSSELYMIDGSIAEIRPEPEPVSGFLPNVSSIIVTFASREDMEATFALEPTHQDVKQSHESRRPL